MVQRVSIIGAGKWGTALAAIVCRAGRETTLIARDAAQAEAINAVHENARHLPGVPLDPRLRATADPAAAGAGEAVLIATPAQAVRATAATLAPVLAPGTPVVLCAKGVEQGTGQLLHEVLAEALPQAVAAALSGPTFAAEVVRGLPTAVTLACAEAQTANVLAAALATPSFRVYASTDPVGVAVGGAVKNVIAIACGIVDGRDLGENARAALMTRGLAEIARLGAALGAAPQTFLGLAGVGDLSLSCTSPSSRNYALGRALGRGQSLHQATVGGRVLAEGVFTAPAVLARAARAGIEMPICAAVDGVLNRGADIDATIRVLLARPAKAEHAEVEEAPALTRHRRLG